MAKKYHYGMRTTIDGAGRIVVPKAVRDRLALTPGVEIEVEVVGDGVLLRPAAGGSAIVVEDGVLVHRGGGAISLDVAAFIRAARTERTAPGAGRR